MNTLIQVMQQLHLSVTVLSRIPYSRADSGED